jgi:hypothetical protein
MTADLAELFDVAVELGLPDDTAMSENQRARAALLISRVSFLFAREAQRDFVPGTATVKLRIQYEGRRAYVRVTEPPAEVSSIVDDNEQSITGYTVKGNEIWITNHTVYDHFSGLNYHHPTFVTVTYLHTDPIPQGVRQSVAAIVARYIGLSDATGSTVQPSASSLQAGGGIVTYRAGFAAWVTQSVHLTKEDKETARSYRHPANLPIVMGT